MQFINYCNATLQMKNLFIRFYSIVSLLILSNISVAQETAYKKDELIVMLKNTGEIRDLIKQLTRIDDGNTHIELKQILSEDMRIYLLSFDINFIDALTIKKRLETNTEVLLAQYNHYFEERIIPNDVQFSAMWDMNNTGQNGGIMGADISATEAWDVATGGLTIAGDTIVAAVVDGGFALTHQDLNFYKNYHEIPANGIDDDANGYTDDFKGYYTLNGTDNVPSASHGTHVSGTVGAKGNNGIGVTGVNWNVKILPIAYSNSGGLESNVVAGYAYAHKQRKLYNETNGANGAFVVVTNSSFGIDNGQPANYPIWCAMYDSLGAVGIVSVAATANQNYNIDVTGDIPTACSSPYLITVTNTTNTDAKYANAGYGATTIDLGAPGTNILSTDLNNTYTVKTGTSMATPHVAGAVALMVSSACLGFINDYKTNPAALALVLKDSLLNASDNIASLVGISVTGGRLNLNKSVRSTLNYCLPNTIANYSSSNEFVVFPNPATHEVFINYPQNSVLQMSCVNAMGQQMNLFPINIKTNSTQLKIDLSDWARGIYFLTITQSNTDSKKVLKLVVL
jgi:serine protease